MLSGFECSSNDSWNQNLLPTCCLVGVRLREELTSGHSAGVEDGIELFLQRIIA